jgi:hypothetical protein
VCLRGVTLADWMARTGVRIGLFLGAQDGGDHGKGLELGGTDAAVGGKLSRCREGAHMDDVGGDGMEVHPAGTGVHPGLDAPRLNAAAGCAVAMLDEMQWLVFL